MKYIHDIHVHVVIFQRTKCCLWFILEILLHFKQFRSMPWLYHHDHDYFEKKELLFLEPLLYG